MNYARGEMRKLPGTSPPIRAAVGRRKRDRQVGKSPFCALRYVAFVVVADFAREIEDRVSSRHLT